MYFYSLCNVRATEKKFKYPYDKSSLRQTDPQDVLKLGDTNLFSELSILITATTTMQCLKHLGCKYNQENRRDFHNRRLPAVFHSLEDILSPSVQHVSWLACLVSPQVPFSGSNNSGSRSLITFLKALESIEF